MVLDYLVADIYRTARTHPEVGGRRAGHLPVLHIPAGKAYYRPAEKRDSEDDVKEFKKETHGRSWEKVFHAFFVWLEPLVAGRFEINAS